MSLARHLDRVLRRNLGMHVAWVPIATRYSLGDYGLRRGGVFEPIGNISEYGVEIETATGREVALDFVSSDATSVRVMGEADVDAFPQAEVEAELRIEFGRRRSLLLKSPRVVSTRITNLAQIGRALTQARREDGLEWMRRYRVVGELFSGDDITLLSTHQADTTVVLSGQAQALRRFEAAEGSAGVSVHSSTSLGLSLVGKSGTLGLDLVRFTRRGVSFSLDDDDELEPESASWDEDEVEDDL